MGGKNSKINKLKQGFSSKSNSNLLQIDRNCSVCSLLFPKNTPSEIYRQHLLQCLQLQDQLLQTQVNVNQISLGNSKSYEQKGNMINNYIYEKVPQNVQKTQFKWQKRIIKQVDHGLLISKSPQQVRNLAFQQKNYWFRYNLQKKRISWTNGADYMKIQRTNVLMCSLIQYTKVNMHKQVKIQFIGDKVNDAGGLLREWIHMVVKEIFDPQTGIVKIANTNQIMYKLKWDQDLDEEFSGQLFTLFGVILGKAIFQKIPIMSYLDQTVLRQLTGRQIVLDDLNGFDKGLYQSFKFILQNQIDSMGLETYFTVVKQSQQSTVKQIQLIQNGKQTQVTDANKDLYVNTCIQHLCSQAVKNGINCMKNGMSKVIPQNLLSVFQPYEIQMLMYGVPFIDVQDWKHNTIYKGFDHKCHVVQWFWQVMQTMDQDKLANFLHFCTGSSRTPIQGFEKMQSNRGNVGRFMIQCANYDKINPYPKGHTCFNRLQLPKYPSKELLNTYVMAIANNHLDGVFGLD